MKNDKSLGLGDLFIVTAFLLIVFRLTGIISTSWVAITHFNIFVLIYLIVVFVLDVVIKVITAAIEKRDE